MLLKYKTIQKIEYNSQNFNQIFFKFYFKIYKINFKILIYKQFKIKCK